MIYFLLRRSKTWLVGLLLALAVVACNTGPADSQAAGAGANLATSAPEAEQEQSVITGTTAETTETTTSNQTAAETTAVVKLNLNTATAADFLTIPGVGNRMVREFQEYRPYTSIQQFRREIGKYVDNQQVAEYEQYVYVPISVNEADAETLQQIPGLDETEASTLIAGRPYASNDAFLAQLSQYVSAEELALATTYLNN
ncbi:MAG: hypothetical protein AB1791_16165 [Chloroflexota bacterium]